MGFSDFPNEAGEDPALTEAVTARRVGGWLVDAIILAILLGVMHLALWILGFVTFGLGWFLLGGLWVVPVAYVFAFVASPAQATPGQALADLRVVRDDDLGRPTPAQALVYAVSYAVTMAAGAFWLVAAFFTRRARCLHDIVAGVTVLRANALAKQAGGAMPVPVSHGPKADKIGWAVR